MAVDGERGPRQGRHAERAFVQPFAGIHKAPPVTAQHFHIGEQIMAQGHRLSTLKMGEAGHDGRGLSLGALDQRRLQVLNAGVQGVDRAAHPKLEVGRHLIVA